MSITLAVVVVVFDEALCFCCRVSTRVVNSCTLVFNASFSFFNWAFCSSSAVTCSRFRFRESSAAARFLMSRSCRFASMAAFAASSEFNAGSPALRTAGAIAGCEGVGGVGVEDVFSCRRLRPPHLLFDAVLLSAAMFVAAATAGGGLDVVSSCG